MNLSDYLLHICLVVSLACCTSSRGERPSERGAENQEGNALNPVASLVVSPDLGQDHSPPQSSPQFDPLQPPVLKRTTVVIDNGFLVPINSFWVRYDPQDQVMTRILAFMIHQHPKPIQSFNADDGKSVLCIANTVPSETYYLEVLLSRMQYYAKGLTFQKSTESCDTDKLPSWDVRNQSINLVETDGHQEHFICTSTEAPQFVYHLKELTLGPESLARLETEVESGGEKKGIQMRNISLVEGIEGEPQLRFADERTSLTLALYRPRGEGFLGTLQAPDQELSLVCVFE